MPPGAKVTMDVTGRVGYFSADHTIPLHGKQTETATNSSIRSNVDLDFMILLPFVVGLWLLLMIRHNDRQIINAGYPLSMAA